MAELGRAALIAVSFIAIPVAVYRVLRPPTSSQKSSIRRAAEVAARAHIPAELGEVKPGMLLGEPPSPSPPPPTPRCAPAPHR